MPRAVNEVNPVGDATALGRRSSLRPRTCLYMLFDSLRESACVRRDHAAESVAGRGFPLAMASPRGIARVGAPETFIEGPICRLTVHLRPGWIESVAEPTTDLDNIPNIFIFYELIGTTALALSC